MLRLLNLLLIHWRLILLPLPKIIVRKLLSIIVNIRIAIPLPFPIFVVPLFLMLRIIYLRRYQLWPSIYRGRGRVRGCTARCPSCHARSGRQRRRRSSRRLNRHRSRRCSPRGRIDRSRCSRRLFRMSS